MRVVAHIDPIVLERELVSRLSAEHPRDGSSRTLVLVPTTRLADHVKRRLLVARPAWIGLEVLSPRALAHTVLDRAGGPALAVAPPLVLDALLDRVLRDLPDSRWSRFVRLRPGAGGRVGEALSELREAGISPGELETVGGEPRVADLAQLFARYERALDELAAAGLTDDAGLARAALAHATRFAESVPRIFVHGAYELVGVHLELVLALARTAEVTVLVPVAPGTRATRYGERLLSSLSSAGTVEARCVTEDTERAARLAALYDEDASPPARPGAIRARHAQGPAAEVKFAVREALAAVRLGSPPTEIAITARSLAPYAAALEEALGDAGLPWTSSATCALRRAPLVREFLLLLRVLAEDFPRDPTVELLRSPRLRWRELGVPARPSAARADRLSREAGIVGSLEEWTTDLSAWAETGRVQEDAPEAAEEWVRARVEACGEIGLALTKLSEGLSRSEATFSEHARGLEQVLETFFDGGGPGDGEAREALSALFGTMADLERVVGDRRHVRFDEMRAWLDEAVGATTLALRPDDDGGLRVLDAVQLRGLTFRQVHVLGMNAGLFPRVAREDPVLPDALRRALRLATGKPIGLKLEAADEERQLLAMLLGAAEERVDVSWQRADESGRAKIASLALREVARLALGAPDLDRLRREALHIPSHPTQWLEALVEHTGLLAPEEEPLLASLLCRDAESTLELAKRFPDLAPGLEMVRSIQSFDPVRAEYDARVGTRGRTKVLSVSDIGTLGRCPLQYFFSRVLAVRELDEPAAAFGFSTREIGLRVHELLHEIYATLAREERFGHDDGEDLVRRALTLLAERRERLFGEAGRRLSRRLPVLGAELTRAWSDAVRRFLEEDLPRIADRGLVPLSLEETLERPVDFGLGVVETVRGKFDRLLEGNGLRVVGDYKTRSKLDDSAKALLMLKGDGRALQVPLYRLLAGDGAVVELLGIHPSLPADEDGRVGFAGFDNADQERGFAETMRVLLELRRKGAFPLRAGRYCDWCAYAQSCRRNHPPTEEREAQMADARDFQLLAGKTKKEPHVR